MRKMINLLVILILCFVMASCGSKDLMDAGDEINASAAVVETAEATLPMEEETTEPTNSVETNHYYFNQLSAEEKELYCLIDESKEQFISNQPVQLIDTTEDWMIGGRKMAERALMAYQFDNPQSSIWLHDTRIVMWWESEPDGKGGYIHQDEGFYVAPYTNSYLYGIFNYVDDPEGVEQRIQEVENKAMDFVKTLEGSDEEKYAAINQWLIDGCMYTIETSYGGDVYGSIVCKASRCSGDAMAFKYVCDMADLPCIIVGGLVDQDVKEELTRRAELEEEPLNHFWTMTWVEGRGWTMTDITHNRLKIEADDEVMSVIATERWLLLDPAAFENTHAVYEGWEFIYPTD